jgi:predicted branched-subunit amino acid permease
MPVLIPLVGAVGAAALAHLFSPLPLHVVAGAMTGGLFAAAIRPEREG